jgi:hypothetical protein
MSERECEAKVSAAATEPLRLCKLCRRARPWREFVWHDHLGGRSGVTARCVACRNRGRKPDPNLPSLRYRVTRHAAKRYLERVRPEWMSLPRGEAFSLARREMRIRMAYAPWKRDWPEWMSSRRLHGDESVGYLMVDDDTLFLLSSEPNGERVIVTVLTREDEA